MERHSFGEDILHRKAKIFMSLVGNVAGGEEKAGIIFVFHSPGGSDVFIDETKNLLNFAILKVMVQLGRSTSFGSEIPAWIHDVDGSFVFVVFLFFQILFDKLKRGQTFGGVNVLRLQVANDAPGLIVAPGLTQRRIIRKRLAAKEGSHESKVLEIVRKSLVGDVIDQRLEVSIVLEVAQSDEDELKVTLAVDRTQVPTCGELLSLHNLMLGAATLGRTVLGWADVSLGGVRFGRLDRSLAILFGIHWKRKGNGDGSAVLGWEWLCCPAVWKSELFMLACPI